MIGGAKDGVIEKVYSAPGHKNATIGSLDWTDARGSSASDLLVKPTNLNIETLLGRETLKEEFITCEGRDGKLLQMKRADNRTCDGHTWDCKNGRDERSCSFHRNLTDTVLVTVEKDSSKVSGIYDLQRHLGYYTHSKQQGFLFRKGERWVIGIFKETSRTGSTIPLTDEGRVDLDLISEIFTSKESTTVPEEGWREITYTRSGSKPASIIVSSLPESINQTMMEDTSKTQEVEEGILCKAKIEDAAQAQREDKENLDFQWLFINFKGSTGKKKCDGTWHCEDGQDEAECNNLASETFTPSIIVTSVVLFTGCLAQLLRAFWSNIKEALPDCLKKTGNSIKKAIFDCLKVDKKRRKKPKKPKAKDLMKPEHADKKTAAKIADKIIRSVQKGAKGEEEENNPLTATNDIQLSEVNEESSIQIAESEVQYQQIHNIEGGVGLLVASGFCLLSTPQERHRLSRLIFAEEKKIHQTDGEVFLCMRKKCHSRKESALFLDHIQPPGFLKKLVYKLTRRPFDWILQKDNRFANILVGGLISFIPVARMTLYIWDFTKDTAIFVYLYLQRWIFITFPTIHHLITLYGISIVLSSVVMCWNTQNTTDNGIVELKRIKNGRLRRVARVLLFVFTLAIPLRYKEYLFKSMITLYIPSIIFKSARLSLKMRMKVAKWRNNKDTESPTAAWVVEKKKKKVLVALSHMKSTEANLEGTVQLFIVICFLCIPFLVPKRSGLGLEFEPSNSSTGKLVLLYVSPVVTLMSNIAATVASLDLNKGRQLSFVGKCIMGTYLLLQLSSHLLRMIPTVLASLPCLNSPPCLPSSTTPALNPLNAALLTFVPIFMNSLIYMMVMSDRIKKLPDKISHLIRQAVLKKHF